MSILLDESLARYLELSLRCGLRGARPIVDRDAADSKVDELAERIAPLRLPEDLEKLWRTWEPASFDGMAEGHAGLLDPSEALGRWPLTAGEPHILLPFAYENDQTWVIELATTDHPGSRILLVDSTNQGPGPDHGPGWARVLAIGTAHFFELMCDAIEASLGAGLSPDDDRFHWLPALDIRDALAAEINQAGANFVDKVEWPAHWLSAEGIEPADFQLRGPTHTVEHFDAARDWHAELSGTLRGTFREVAVGEILNGTVGYLEDDTGSIQVFIPDTAAILGDPSGEVEMDVRVEQQAAKDLVSDDLSGDSQPGNNLGPIAIEAAGFVDDTSAHADFFHDLFDAMSRMDLSVVVTAVRPVR